MKILDRLKEEWTKFLEEKSNERAKGASFEIKLKLSLSERLEEVYEIVGATHRKIDESIFSHTGFTSSALSLYRELEESCEEVKKIQSPMIVEDYERLDKFHKTYVALNKELGVTSIPEDITFYSDLSKIAKSFKSASTPFPKHIRNQAGIEIVKMYISSPFESIKIYEVAGKRPSFDKLSESLEKDGFKLKKITKNDILGEMIYHLFPFVFPFVETEEGVLKAIPLAYPKEAKSPTIYFCRGPRYYVDHYGILASFGISKSFYDQTVHEYVFTQDFPVYMYNFEGELVERLRNLFISSSNLIR